MLIAVIHNYKIMSWFSNLFKRKEKETQPIASPKTQSTVYQPSLTKNGKDIEIRTKRSIERDFQGKFIKGHSCGPRDSKTGKFIKR